MMLNSDLLDKISYKIPPRWKIPLYEFIGGKLKLMELEQELYKFTELEVIIGEEIYIELVSFDFADIRNYNDIVRFIMEKILVEENEYDCKMFVLIGKFYLSDISQKLKKAKNLPEAVVSIFEGAHIQVDWEGVDSPASDIKFLKEISYPSMFNWDYGNILPLSAVEIGYAYGNNERLLMDDDGIVYFDSCIINAIYNGGEFFNALKLLFFGLGNGKRIYPLSQEYY